MTWGWTDGHNAVAATVAVALVAAAAGLLHPTWFGGVVIGLVALVAVGGLATDAFGGLVLGLVAAAGSIALERSLGHWDADLLWPSAVETLALLGTGGAAGQVGTALRGDHGRQREEVPATGFAPVYGSLGLLSAGIAIARLDEEVERSRLHRRPLTVTVFFTVVVDEELDPAARDAALRAVARLVESQVRVIDVPFALRADTVGVILPETTPTRAWDVVAPIVDAAGRAHFVVRREDRTRPLAEAVVLQVGMATVTDQTTDGRQLLTQAAEAAQARSTDRGAA